MVRKKEKPHATTRPQRHLLPRLVAGLSGLGGVGMSVWLVGPAASYLLGLLLLLAMVGLAWSAIFSPREEPSQRLEHLIRALRGRHRR